MNNIIKKYDIYIYIAFAYLFSIAIRYIWVYQFSGTESFYWNNEIMINTNDGYYFATVVKDMLYGSNPDNQLLSVALDTYPGTIYSIYYFTKFSPFSLDTVILYAPAFVSSLIVIPIILTMRLYNMTLVGFFAALLASITWSFYNRTMIGYFDTDMYALVFPVFILYFLMKFLKDNKLLDIFIAAVITSVYVIFYPQGYAAITALFIAFLIYGVLFIRENKQPFYASLVLMSIALVKIMLLLKLGAIIGLFVLLNQQFLKEDKRVLYLAIIAVLAFIFTGDGYSLMVSKIGWYTKTGVESGTLHFYDVAQTIREAGKIPFETFANRISGSTITFVIAIFGYLLLLVRRKEFLLFLPLISIGFFAYIGGLRFTVYAVPAMAIAAVYFFYFISEQFIKEVKHQYMTVAVATLLLLYPNINHVIDYKVPTVLNKQEVNDLEKLKKISTPKDYTLSWWDYGYPIWYYSDTNTLIDGGKHHQDNFLISKILFSTSENLTANLSRVVIEEYTKQKLGYSPVAREILKGVNTNEYFKKLSSSEFTLPEKTRDVYLYLPYRMLNIFPTVGVFSNLNLKTGKRRRNIMFYPTQPVSEKNGQVVMANGIVLDMIKGEVSIGSKKVKVRNFDIVTLGKNALPQVQAQLSHIDGKMSVIFMKNYNKMIVMDNATYNSAYVQMFMLGKYDKNLFELVVSSPYSKIYKLKK